MLTEIQEKWLQALESGKYKQGIGRLKRVLDGEIKYCCLGVACEVLEISSELREDGIYTFNGDAATLPRKAVKELGLRNSHGMIHRANPESETQYLSVLNDNGMSFRDIAKFIRENPERVFNNELNTQTNQ